MSRKAEDPPSKIPDDPHLLGCPFPRVTVPTVSRTLSTITCLLLALVCTAARSPTPPHIVLFIADDYTWHDAGPYGAHDVRTPNIDNLAKASLRFDSAFAASPTCTPSRSAIYTGLYPFRNGAHANHSMINDAVRTLPQYMKDLGYRVAIAGKTHIGPRSSFPFEFMKDSNIMPPGKNHILWTDLNTTAVDKLLATHDRDKTPLCLIVCSHSPHVYWPENNGYDPAKLKLPPYFVDTPKTRENLARYYTDVTWMDKQLGEVLASLDHHGYADNCLFIFTADQGAQWPFAKWTLYDAGIRVPLLVRWPNHVKPNATTADLVSLIDLLPTMIESAGGTPPDNLDGHSLFGTYHRQEIFASHTGDKEMNHAPMRCIRTPKYKYILNLAPQIPFRTHIIADTGPDAYWPSWVKKAKEDTTAAALVDRYQHHPPEELYEIKSDPYEQHNLASDPTHAQDLADLRQRLKQWRLQQGEDPTKAPMPEDARYGDTPYAN